MPRFRLIMWSILLVILAGAIGYRLRELRQPPPPRPVKIAFVTGGSGPYWQVTVNGARAAAERNNVELQVEVPADNESLEQQTAILEKLDLAQLGGVAISPLDAVGQTPLIDKIAETTKVVTFDSDAPTSHRHSYIGTGNNSAGRACARLVAEALPAGGKIAVLLANPTKENLIERRAGFEEYMAGMLANAPESAAAPRYDVVGFLIDNGNVETCSQNIRETLEKHPDLACFIGLNSAHGPVLVKVLKEQNKLGQIKLITFDVPEETLAGVEAGHIYATLAQDPYKFGFDAIETLNTLAHGDGTMVPIVGRGAIFISAEPIKQADVAALRERMKKQMAAPDKVDAVDQRDAIK